MPLWGSILFIAGLSAFAVASVFAVVHHTHRRLPARQAPQGNPETDVSAPISLDLAHANDSMEAGDAMTAREVEEKRVRARTRAATYELALPGTPTRPALDVVSDLPPAEVGEVLFYQGSFWRVDAIEPATSQEADARLVVTRTTDRPRSAA